MSSETLITSDEGVGFPSIDFIKTIDGYNLYPITLTAAVYNLDGVNLDSLLSLKAPSSHTHTVNEISDLRSIIDENLGNMTHTHPASSITDLEIFIYERMFPIGKYYFSETPDNPGTLWGFGTWEQVEDVFLLAAGTKYSAGSTGGEATHTLSASEIPSHNHSISIESNGAHTHQIGSDRDVNYVAGGDCWSVHNSPTGASYMNGTTSSNGAHTHTASIGNTGGGVAHNNMPPYRAIYVYKRIS